MKSFPKPAWSFWLFLGLFLAQGAWVLFYASPLPFMDEWEAFLPNAFPAGFSGTWLFVQHNEHRIIWTKIQSWIFYWLNGWDLRAFLAFNYFGLFALLLWLVKKVLSPVGKKASPELWLSLCFLCSPLLHQNHFWAFQSQFHFMLIFLLLAAYQLFYFRNSGTFVGGLLAALACAYSFSNGVVASAVLMGAWGLWGQRSRSQKIFGLLIFALGLAAWFVDFQKTPGAQWLYPWQWAFWPYFLNTVSLGFGVNGQSLGLGIFCALLLVVPWGYDLWKDPKTLKSSESRAQASLILALLASLAVITLGRGASGLGAKSSRYAEISILLLPLSVAAWQRCSIEASFRKKMLRGFFIFLAISFVDDWKFNKIYRTHYLGMIDGEQCLKDYVSGKNPEAFCPTLYPGPLKGHLQSAQALDLFLWRLFR